MMLGKIILVFVAIASCARAGVIDDTGGGDDGSGSSSSKHHHRRRILASASKAFFVSNDLYARTCTNERCNDVADLFLQSVKKSINPCDDFFGFACSRKQSKMRSLTKEIREILEQHQHHHHHHQQQRRHQKEETNSLALERKFYKSCMEQRDGDPKTRAEFTRLMRESNGLSLFEPGRKLGHLDWESTDGLYASLGFEHAFFNVHVTRDPANYDVNLISIMPPSPLYFYSIHSLLKYKNFTGIISNLVDDYSKSDNPYVTDFKDVIDFNNALHQILPPIGMLRENITTLKNNKMTIDDWQRVYDFAVEDEDFSMEKGNNHINWLKLVNSFLKTATISVDHSEKIVVKKIDYFTKLAKLLEKTSPVSVEKYIHFKFLAQISKYLSPSLAKFFENVDDRSTFCIKQSDNQLIGATYEYIKRYVSPEHKAYAEEIAENVRTALMNLLSDAEWMDKETKNYAANKLKSLEIVIGYPEWQINKTFVNDYYGNLHLQSNFFENVIKYKRKSLIHELRGLKHSHTFDPLTMSKNLGPLIYHFDVNSHMNRILFPTEYLNEKKYKLFSTQLPSSINYGSFGSMIGSILYDYVSLTDDMKYNKFYTRTNAGMSKDTIEAYKMKEKCLSNQLTNYKKSESQLNQPVIDSDTVQVDKIYEKMTGLRAAFEAFRKIKGSKQELLPGFETMTSLQLFFLSYAERICEIGDIYDKYDTYETSLKVNGVLSNLEVFSDVFQCSRLSHMNRDTKCELFS